MKQLGFNLLELELEEIQKENVKEVMTEVCVNCTDCRLSQLHPANRGMIWRGSLYGRVAVIGIAPGKTEMMDIEEPIPTPKGWVKNGDLAAGDRVFGQDGKSYTVLEAHPIRKEQVYRISFDDNTWVDVHAGHLWTTFSRKERNQVTTRSERFREQTRKRLGSAPKEHLRGLNTKEPPTGTVRRTDEIYRTLRHKEGDTYRLNHSVDVCQPIDLPEVTLPIHPYALGCWLGDGNSRHNGFYSIDQEILERLERIANVSCKPWKNGDGKCPTYGLNIPGQEGPTRNSTTGRLEPGESFYSELKKLQVIGNKHIPDQYLWASANQRLELLRGLMDTDGGCSQYGQVKFSNTNLALAEGVYHLAASLGIKPTIVGPVVEKPKFNKKSGQVYGENLPSWLVKWTSSFPVFGLSRKAECLPKETRLVTKRRYITDVQVLSEVKKMRCLTVDNPTGLYLFGKNFNVTHNTEKGAAMIGKSGKLLEQWLRYVGLDSRTDVFISNVAQCQPPEKKISGRLKQRDPEKDEINACFGPRCLRVLRAMPNLEVVITLGWVAAKAFLGTNQERTIPKTKTHEGQWFESSLLPGIPIFCLTHPAEILYSDSDDKKMTIQHCLDHFKREYIKTRKIIELAAAARTKREELGLGLF